VTWKVEKKEDAVAEKVMRVDSLAARIDIIKLKMTSSDISSVLSAF